MSTDPSVPCMRAPRPHALLSLSAWLSFSVAVLLSALLFLSTGCEKSVPEPAPVASAVVRAPLESPAPSPKVSPASVPEKPSPVAEADASFRFPASERVVAIGDLHGDFSATERAFRLAGAIDDKGHWSGGTMTVVQTGDQLDRGDDERKIIDFLVRLGSEAEAAGGAVLVLNGNHETMNVAGDFRYVTDGARKSFDDLRNRKIPAAAFPPAFRGRAQAFLPGGGAAKLLSERRVIVMVGETLFAHGGVLPAHVAYGIERINEETGAWMRGEREAAPELIVDQEGPVWTRQFAPEVPTPAACTALASALSALGARRLVVGHSIQAGGISFGCKGQVVRIDVGLSKYYGDRAVQILEIRGKEAKILTEN